MCRTGHETLDGSGDAIRVSSAQTGRDDLSCFQIRFICLPFAAQPETLHQPMAVCRTILQTHGRSTQTHIHEHTETCKR